MATILVTGGAGYVGAHCCLALKRAGHEPVVYDNLSNGYPAFVRWGPLEQGDVRDKPRLREVFTKHKPEAVIHCAASIEVGESVKHPDRFYENNVVGALTLFDVMHETGVKVFVFSSTCAIYGEPISLPMDETHRQQPVSPYGWTKLMVERMSRDCSAAYGAGGTHRRTPRARDARDPPGALHPARAARQFQSIRRRLRHARWLMPARLCACAGFGGCACACGGSPARRRRKHRGEPRHRPWRHRTGIVGRD
jgi:nucleoside-diphosphate-sugar epimerase